MPRYSAHLGYLFQELPLEERYAAAAAAGFRAVEHPAPYALSAERTAQLITDNGLEFVQLALPTAADDAGRKGIACLPGRDADFRDALDRALDFAAAIGCRFVHPMAGTRPPGIAQDALLETYVANLALAADAASARDMTILVEAIGPGTIADYFLADPHDALAAIDATGCDNVFLLFDTFHAASLSIDPAAFLHTHLPRVAHIHLADFPGRHEPGTGEIAFPSLLALLDRAAFGGWCGLEYIPRGTTMEGLGWMMAPEAQPADKG